MLEQLDICKKQNKKQPLPNKWASLVAQTVKNLPAWETRLDPWVGKISWRREWQPNPVSLPREFHGQRSLVGSQKSDVTERLTPNKHHTQK